MIEQFLEIWPSDWSPYAAMLKVRRSSRFWGAMEPVGLIFAEKKSMELNSVERYSRSVGFKNY